MPFFYCYLGGLAVSALDSGSTVLNSSFCWVVSVVFLGKTLKDISYYNVLHCTSLFLIISCVVSARTLKNGSFVFMAIVCQRGKSLFYRKRPW